MGLYRLQKRVWKVLDPYAYFNGGFSSLIHSKHCSVVVSSPSIKTLQ